MKRLDYDVRCSYDRRYWYLLENSYLVSYDINPVEVHLYQDITSPQYKSTNDFFKWLNEHYTGSPDCSRCRICIREMEADKWEQDKSFQISKNDKRFFERCPVLL